jgi:anti-anti-sigma factor
MAEAQLEANVRLQAGMAIIDLRGDIDGFAEAALVAAYLETSELQPSALALNFSQVDYINSTGIALIVGLLARARKDKHPVIAFGLSDHFAEIFEITRLSDFMRIVSDEAAALQGTAEEKSL